MAGLFRDSIPSTDIDLWTEESIRNSEEINVSKIGPVVRLNKHDCFFVGSHKAAQAVLSNWKIFSSTGRPFGVDDQSLVPRILVTEDPPEHKRARDAIMKILGPEGIKGLESEFTRQAEVIVDEMLRRQVVDGVQELAANYILKIFPDIIGLPSEGREKILKFGLAAFNGAGPRNEILTKSIVEAEDAFAWMDKNATRETVSSGGMASKIYQLEKDGVINKEEADLLVLTLLGAGFDTTMTGIGNTLHALSQDPEQWDALREDPSLVKAAFEESLRFDPPPRMLGRLVMSDTELEGMPLKQGDVVGVFLKAAGRDESRWDQPGKFDVRRRGPHLGFGVGVHSCAGQLLARVEFECLFRVLLQKVKRIELAGNPVRLINNNIQGWVNVPLKLHAV
ncbi:MULTISPECIES: cytochrome P450 [unclassified Pseudomonas]|uniref:cytochrome P450 n=1 Tax=unclassified Pseudomonas TaxID=196821 RepID=UPI0024582C85|nr:MULTISPECIES: cytochrome P450 [unclassified Pseudomonas]MDH4561315.1 cytochrome P450 [Pseudomonas sp. BN411]MDH4656993.1 cytochrome P450 [Pseudomonas sp. BN606]